MISVIIVVYNAVQLLEDCLRSIYASQKCPEFEVIVIDNGSKDDTSALLAKAFRQVRLIRNEGNRGFGAANNQGIAASQGNAVLLLNSDTVVEPLAISHLRAALDANPEVGAVAPRLLNRDGTLQHSIAPIYDLCAEISWLRRRKLKRLSNDILAAEANRVLSAELYASGAALMVRADALHELGGFDENFFMYSEDADLCLRLIRAGWYIMYVPMARTTHVGGGSTGEGCLLSSVENLRGRIMLCRKHNGASSALAVYFTYLSRHARRMILNSLVVLLSLGLYKRARTKAASHARICAWLMMGAPSRGSWMFNRLIGVWR